MVIENISVTNLDRSNTDEILEAIRTTDASEVEPKELSLELNNVQGDVLLAYEIIKAVNTSSVHLVTNSTGTLSVAGTILAAAGKPSRRSAEVSTIFVLNDSAKQKQGKSRRVSNPNAEFLFVILSELSGKKSPIKKTLAEKDSITSFEAQKLGLIDSANEFKSKYELLKTKENEKEGKQPVA